MSTGLNWGRTWRFRTRTNEPDLQETDRLDLRMNVQLSGGSEPSVTKARVTALGGDAGGGRRLKQMPRVWDRWTERALACHSDQLGGHRTSGNFPLLSKLGPSLGI